MHTASIMKYIIIIHLRFHVICMRNEGLMYLQSLPICMQCFRRHLHSLFQCAACLLHKVLRDLSTQCCVANLLRWHCLQTITRVKAHRKHITSDVYIKWLFKVYYVRSATGNNQITFCVLTNLVCLMKTAHLLLSLPSSFAKVELVVLSVTSIKKFPASFSWAWTELHSDRLSGTCCMTHKHDRIGFHVK